MAAVLGWRLRSEFVLLFASVLFGIALYASAAWLSERSGLSHVKSILVLYVSGIVASLAFVGFAGHRPVGRSRVSHGIEVLARLGYTAKGIVYVGVGMLTAAAAFQVGSQAGSTNASGSRDALSAIGSATWGVVALGLAAYGILQGVKAWYRRIGPVSA